jgi:hypothetical protein
MNGNELILREQINSSLPFTSVNGLMAEIEIGFSQTLLD